MVVGAEAGSPDGQAGLPLLPATFAHVYMLWVRSGLGAQHPCITTSGQVLLDGLGLIALDLWPGVKYSCITSAVLQQAMLRGTTADCPRPAALAGMQSDAALKQGCAASLPYAALSTDDTSHEHMQGKQLKGQTALLVRSLAAQSACQTHLQSGVAEGSCRAAVGL